MSYLIMAFGLCCSMLYVCVHCVYIIINLPRGENGTHFKEMVTHVKVYFVFTKGWRDGESPFTDTI